MPPRIPSSMPISFNARGRRPPQPPSEPEPSPDLDEPPDDADPFAEDDALTAMDPSEFYWRLRGDVDRVAAGEIPGQREIAHPGPKERPRSKRYRRRDKHGNAF